MKLLLFFLALLLPSVGSAQEPAKSAKTSIKVRLLAVVVPPDLGKVYLISDDARSPEFDLPANNVSELLPVSGRTVGLKTTVKDIPLCNIRLPEEGKRFVVVLTPAKPSGYAAHVIRTDDPSFKRGDCFFANLTRKAVLGKLGTKNLLLESGKTAVTRPEGARKENFHDIAFATRDDAGDRILSTTRWPVDNQIRSYVFFVEDSTGHISYRAVDEFVEDEK